MNEAQFAKDFQSNYDRIYNFLGGSDQQLMMSLASKYTLSKKQFSGVSLTKILEKVEDQSKSLSLKSGSSISYKIASNLLEKDNLTLSIKNLEENNQLLQSVKFKSNPFLTIAAFFLQDDKKEHAIRAKHLFDEMNRNQRFLTSNEDIPYCVLLTLSKNVDIQQQANTIIRYYQELKKHFTIGNHLQALAQIMTLYSSDYNQVFMQYVVQLRDELIKRQVKVKKVHYPFIGILALAATDYSKIEEIVRLHNQLLQQKAFRHSKEYALVVAIQKVVKDLSDIQDVVDLTPLSHINQLLSTVNFLDNVVTFFPIDVIDMIDFFK